MYLNPVAASDTSTTSRRNKIFKADAATTAARAKATVSWSWLPGIESSYVSTTTNSRSVISTTERTTNTFAEHKSCGTLLTQAHSHL